MSMSMGVATTFAEKLLTAFPGVPSAKRVQTYAERIARFDEGTAYAAIDYMIEHCKGAPSVAEMLEELRQRSPASTAPKEAPGYPPGLDPEAEVYYLEGRPYVRAGRTWRREYLAQQEAQRLNAREMAPGRKNTEMKAALDKVLGAWRSRSA